MKKRTVSLFGVVCLTVLHSHAYAQDDYTSSEVINKAFTSYSQYDEFSDKYSNLIFNTPGSSSATYPGVAFFTTFNGTDASDFGGYQLRMNNIKIVAGEGSTIGINNMGNNILLSGFEIDSTAEKYTGIRNQNNENPYAPHDRFSVSQMILEDGVINLRGDNSTGVFNYKLTVNEDSFARVYIDRVSINTYGVGSQGINVINADVGASRTSLNIYGENSQGVFVSNGGSVSLEETSINAKGENSSGIFLSRQNTSNFNDEIIDKQVVSLSGGSSVDVDRGIGVNINSGNGFVSLDNGSSIKADVLANSVSSKGLPATNLEVNAKNNSLLQGSVYTDGDAKTSINLESNSRWIVTGGSNLTNLSVSNADVVISTNGGNFTTLSVDNLNGDSGRIGFRTDISGSNSSKLIINNSSSGSYQLNILNSGSENTNGSERIVLVEDKSTGNDNAVFSSATKVELGGYEYEVVKSSAGNDWILAPSDSSSPEPVINMNAKSIISVASTSYLLNLEENSTLRQRLGNLKARSNYTGGSWVRAYGGKFKNKERESLAKADMKYHGVKFGADLNLSESNEYKSYLGFFAGTTQASPSFDRGSGDIHSWYAGLYSLVVNDSDWYLDSKIKLGKYSNEFKLRDSQGLLFKGKDHSMLASISAQTGKRYDFLMSKNFSYYVEPQFQFTYSHIGKFDAKATNGLRVKQKSYASKIARAGLVLGLKMDSDTDFYVKGSYGYEFNKDIDVKLNGSPEKYNFHGRNIELGLGANITVAKNSYIYAEADYIKGKSMFTGSKFNLGYRYNF